MRYRSLIGLLVLFSAAPSLRAQDEVTPVISQAQLEAARGIVHGEIRAYQNELDPGRRLLVLQSVNEYSVNWVVWVRQVGSLIRIGVFEPGANPQWKAMSFERDDKRAPVIDAVFARCAKLIESPEGKAQIDASIDTKVIGQSSLACRIHTGPETRTTAEVWFNNSRPDPQLRTDLTAESRKLIALCKPLPVEK